MSDGIESRVGCVYCSTALCSGCAGRLFDAPVAAPVRAYEDGVRDSAALMERCAAAVRSLLGPDDDVSIMLDGYPDAIRALIDAPEAAPVAPTCEGCNATHHPTSCPEREPSAPVEPSVDAANLRLAEAQIERLTADLDHTLNGLGAAVLRAERAEERVEAVEPSVPVSKLRAAFEADAAWTCVARNIKRLCDEAEGEGDGRLRCVGCGLDSLACECTGDEAEKGETDA